MRRSFGPAARRRAQKKTQGVAPVFAGPQAWGVAEPPDHALGRSQGGFGTKVHLVCEGHGTVLGIWVTPGQRHESQAFSIVLLRAKRPRWTGHARWPHQLAGDRGYSYPTIRRWLERHHIGAVIPSRKNQLREDAFERATYRRRNLIERVVGWYKECRALGTRYEKLAVNYVALWVVALIDKLVRKYEQRLQPGLSERT
jgi:transposase